MAEAPKRITQLLSYLDSSRASLVATVRNANPSLCRVRPRDGVWSVAEVLGHLVLVEEGVAALMVKSVNWARSHGIAPATSDDSVMENIERLRLADPAVKMQAPDFVVPREEKSVEESLSALKRSRETMRGALVAGSDLDLTAVTRPHRLFGEINLYQWALFVADHEDRHRKQIEATVVEVAGLAAKSTTTV